MFYLEPTTTHCVSDATELQDALIAAQTNDSHDIIKGIKGTYNGNFTFNSAEGRNITRKGLTARYLTTACNNLLALNTGREDDLRTFKAVLQTGEGSAVTGNKHFWRGDIMCHHRKGYYASARFYSTRTVSTDGPHNREGLKSHHLSDGCNVLLRTGGEYQEVFPAWDWQKIPGTTVEQRPELTGSPRRMGETRFAGGVSDGEYGLAAFDLKRDGLTARKSWFFFDDEYVCLGAGITCGSDHPVVTTLNQRNLEGDVWIGDASAARKLDKGLRRPERPSWVWHDEIAYVLLDTAAVHLRNDLQRGSWHEINQRYSKEQVARDVFTLWVDHGSSPQNGSYAYAVVPGIERTAVEAFAMCATMEKKMTVCRVAVDSPPPGESLRDVCVGAIEAVQAQEQEVCISYPTCHEFLLHWPCVLLNRRRSI